MARPLRLEFPGAIYHVTSRGNGGSDIYASDEDRMAFLNTLTLVVERFGWRCHSYCLMGNHYHLLIETPRANLSAGMRQLNGVYTQTYNRAHQRRGHVFQGRYKAVLVERDSHLLELCRYIARNPVAIGWVNEAGEWPWSSYRAIVGAIKSPSFLTTDWVLRQFAGDRAAACRAYASFVNKAEIDYQPWTQVVGGTLLGSAAYLETLEPLLSDHKDSREIPAMQRLLDRPDLRGLVCNISDKEQRLVAVYEAVTTWGYTLTEIADVLGVHYSTISRMVKKAEKTLQCKT